MNTEPEPADLTADTGEAPDRTQQRWTLTRNCAMSPQLFALHVAAMCAVLGAIGLGFCIAGYPAILVCCLLQVLALVAAALVHALHAIDGEQIVLGPQALEVHITHGLRSRTVRMHPAWSRLERMDAGRPPALCCGSTRVPVAVHLCDAHRRRFVTEFERDLGRLRAGVAVSRRSASSAPDIPPPTRPTT